MADAIADTLRTGTHGLVQAGTGTGKSLGYLAPALAHIADTGERIVVATATLALQAQLASKDIPAALDAAEQVLGTRARAAILKGRTNYACLYRVREGLGEEQEALLGGTADVGTRGRSGGTLADRAGGHLLRAVAPTAVLIALMWIAWLVLLVGGRLIIPGAGLIPRHLAGLDGVLFSPLLHGGWRHLIGNTTALLVLGPVSGLVSRRPVALLAAAWLGSGLVTWLIGTPGVHIGASGIVYALIAFLLVYGVVARRVLAVVVSLVVAVTHLGSSLLGLLPAPESLP